MVRYFLEFSMKSRILLLIGALLIITPQLNGCVGTMVQRANDLTARITGADDPNNKGFMAESGRLSNAMANGGMALLEGKPVEGVTAPAPAAAVAPMPVAKVASPAPKPAPKPAANKKATVSASSVQPVAATPADQRAAKPAKVAPKKPPVEDKKPG